MIFTILFTLLVQKRVTKQLILVDIFKLILFECVYSHAVMLLFVFERGESFILV